MEFKGIVTHKTDVEMVGKSKDIAKFTVGIREGGAQYPKSIAVDFLKDNVDVYKNAFKLWDTIVAHLSPRYNARTWDDGKEKIFNTILCWKVDVVSVCEGVESSEEKAQKVLEWTEVNFDEEKEKEAKKKDDLPF